LGKKHSRRVEVWEGIKKRKKRIKDIERRVVFLPFAAVSFIFAESFCDGCSFGVFYLVNQSV